MLGRAPEAGNHIDAAHLQSRGLRIFVFVDHVFVEGVGHQLASFGFHPGGNEGSEVQPGVAVKQQFVMNQVVSSFRQDLSIRKVIAWDWITKRMPTIDRCQFLFGIAEVSRIYFFKQHCSPPDVSIFRPILPSFPRCKYCSQASKRIVFQV